MTARHLFNRRTAVCVLSLIFLSISCNSQARAQPHSAQAGTERPGISVASATAPPSLSTPSQRDAPPSPSAPAAPAAFTLNSDFTASLAAWSEFTLAQPLPAYPLNEHSRTVPARGKLPCPDVPLASYRGTALRYGKALRVYEGLVARLQAFEEVVAATAKEFYGRAPVRIDTLGTYNCRRMRTYPTYISEHAFGNAIDVAGFVFAPARKSERAKIRRELWGAQTVTVLRDWQGGRGAKATHQKFLQTLVMRLIENDVFRLYLGPSFPGHQDHLHLDMSNFRMIEI